MSIAPGSLSGAGGTGGVAAAAAETAAAGATPTATPAASTPAVGGTPAPSTAAGSSSASRLQVDDMMTAFQKQLGPNWERYRDVLTHFLVGRLSRHELQEALDGILDRSMVKMHNQFLLANLCNSLRAAPADGATGRMTSWSRKRGRGGAGAQKVKGDTQMAQLKRRCFLCRRVNENGSRPSHERPAKGVHLVDDHQHTTSYAAPDSVCAG